MNNRKYNYIAYLLLVGFILSAVLGCVSYSQNMVMDEGHSTTIARCCLDSLIADIASHNTPSILVKLGLSLFLLAYFIFGFKIKLRFVKIKQLFTNYLKLSKQSGGFNLFNSFLLVFSQGIIHPKTY